MARHRQEGNRYFSLDVDFFSDKKIKILKARYGADGITLYIYLLCEIFKSGYYLKVDDDFEFIISDDLNMSSDKVRQVLAFLLERSLFEDTLFQSDAALTSAGIQRRYQRMVKSRAVKTPAEVDGRYWLLSEEETETFIKVRHNQDNSEKKEDNSEKNSVDSGKYDIKEKEKKRNSIYTAAPGRYFENDALNEAFLLFIGMRRSKGDDLTEEQVLAYRDDLLSMSVKVEEQTAIVKKAFMNGWKNFYPPRGRSQQKKQTPKNRFNNFHQREYDFGEYEKQLLDRGQNGGG